jgi:hypothetical protein
MRPLPSRWPKFGKWQNGLDKGPVGQSSLQGYRRLILLNVDLMEIASTGGSRLPPNHSLLEIGKG